MEAATKATMVLEDAGETNAGYGSNLTESGTVEMDAGLMDGTSLLFGSVGAISGVKNPILVANKLVEEQQKGLLPLGRVPPGFLVGEGATEWAVRHNIQTIQTENLISDKAAKLYRHYKKKLDAYKMSMQVANAKRKRIELSRSSGSNHISSTSISSFSFSSLPEALFIFDVLLFVSERLSTEDRQKVVKVRQRRRASFILD